MLAYSVHLYPARTLDCLNTKASNATAKELCALDSVLPCQVELYSANAEIYAQGERPTAFYQVEYGAVRLCRLLSDGRRQICAFHIAGEVFGFAVESQHHVFAEAICDAAIRIYRQPLAEDKLILSLTLKELVRAQRHQLVIGRQTAAERIAALVVDLHERLGGATHIELAMSRSDIADYLGLTIETVSRVVSKFRSKGYIRLHGTRVLEIVQLDVLRSLCA